MGATITRLHPVCEECRDTHFVGGVACKHCPTPCSECRDRGLGAFCQTTPCPCACHQEHEREQARERVRSAGPALLLVCQAALADIEAALHGRRPPMDQIRLAAALRAAIFGATGAEP